MPAKHVLRISDEGVYSHVFNRGVENRIIFKDDNDYDVFISFLKDYLTAPEDTKVVKKNFTIKGKSYQGIPHQPKNYFNCVDLIAYNLNQTSFSLLLHQRARGSIEKFMRSLCTRYSMYFNKKYSRSGSLFEGPYKSIQIKDDLGLLLLTHNLHTLKNTTTSFNDYISGHNKWIKSESLLNIFNNEKSKLSKLPNSYRSFIQNYELNDKERDIINSITFETKEVQHEGILLESKPSVSDSFVPINAPLRIPEFTIATLVFFVLVTLGVRNINVSSAKVITSPTTLGASETSITTSSYEQTVEYSPNEANIETAQEVTTEDQTVQSESTTKINMATIRITDGVESVNIRSAKSVKSEKIGQALEGETFEIVSQDDKWYEVKLHDGSIGFISARYIISEEDLNE